MKRLLLFCVFALAIIVEAGAVLKEKDLEQTLGILRTELKQYNSELTRRSTARKDRTKRLIQQLMSTMKRADQNALMLYSQQQDNVFDLTYACHEATKQYHDFHRNQLPFTSFLEKTEGEIVRYDSLINHLQGIPTRIMTKYGAQNRDSCLVIAKSIREKLEDNASTLRRNIYLYTKAENRLKELNEYANKRYNEIQQNIFINGGDSYPTLIQNLSRRWQQMGDNLRKKYSFNANANSQWSAEWIFGMFLGILFYVIVAIILNLLFFKFALPNKFKTEEFKKKRSCIIMATTTFTFAIIQGLVISQSSQNFLIMASSLLVEYSWLLGVILISLLLRVKGEQIKSAFRIYAPLIAVGFVVIGCRIILIPNELVNLILPPILLACTIWQWIVIRRHNQNIPRSDIFYTYISLIVFVSSVVCSFIGYTLFAVQLIIWWIMQLTCILTINCLSRYLEIYAKRKRLMQKPITKTWAYYLVEKTVIPILGVHSVMLSIYWAAKVFNLTDMCIRIFMYPIINMENLQVSIIKLTMVINAWFLFRYISKTTLAFLRMHYEISDPSTAASKEVMGRNVIQVLVWGAWLMFSLSLFHISLAWLLAISGGLSTGIGFASKDIIENIYYGASLMAGRIKVGDWIDVDGTMGKVVSISYTSTIIESMQGEVIGFQNAQLFTKNYKNLTRNHGYVMASVPFGVAYGSNLKEVANMVEEAVNRMRHQYLDPEKQAKCIVTEMADSSVNFKLVVWVDAPKRAVVISDMLKCIYDTLNEHNISIPFPQRDIHMIS
ncbi:mechanosensitive ion channel family protein [Xylanibacter ruminicola]|uniref:Mechanosensitive ion channel n=1 Tax=Xylanibacter ruminicola TaxID=839 RepID=A0A1M6VVZ0_XYLRU|nr:mechanosensitive ion channel family protein [Xylanibacter ruminicola]SHK85630.1 Mechanosensitive ion channel [Xylanibacter ruminicola]